MKLLVFSLSAGHFAISITEKWKFLYHIVGINWCIGHLCLEFCDEKVVSFSNKFKKIQFYFFRFCIPRTFQTSWFVNVQTSSHIYVHN